jgi:plasmid stabilization system protein ParE
VTYRLIFSPTARADTRRAFLWINERSPATAARWSAGLIKIIDTLKENPELHAVSEEASTRYGFEVREMLYPMFGVKSPGPVPPARENALFSRVFARS